VIFDRSDRSDRSRRSDRSDRSRSGTEREEQHIDRLVAELEDAFYVERAALERAVRTRVQRRYRCQALSVVRR
jgi:hypothetical protein